MLGLTNWSAIWYHKIRCIIGGGFREIYYTCFGVDMMNKKDLVVIVSAALAIGASGVMFYFLHHAHNDYEALQATVDKLQALSTDARLSTTGMVKL